MTGNIAIDVAIGLVFIYLLYSLLATVIGEIIASVFALRARNLQDAIGKMLNDDTEESTKFKAFFKSIWQSISKIFNNKQSGFVEAFYKQPSIKYLSHNSQIRKPSYISPATFSQTLLNIMEDEGKGDSSIDRIKAVLSGELQGTNVGNDHSTQSPLICDETRKHLSNLLRSSNDDLAKFKLQLESWFDETMERATGWYKRKNQFILFSIGLVIAISFNVNTLYIGKALSKDDLAREQLVQMAVNYQNKNPEVIQDSTDKKALKELLAVKDSLEKDIQIANSIVSLGWEKMKGIDKNYYNDVCHNIDDLSAWKNLLGWILTALAISLGATFWFDLLNKLVNLRSSLAAPKPRKSDKESKKES